MPDKYPLSAYSGARARLPDWFIGVPYARYLDRAVGLLDLRDGSSVCDVACGPATTCPGWCVPWDPAGR